MSGLLTIDAITQFVNGTEAAWDDTTIPVPTGLIVYAPDTKNIKVGDGVTLYAALPIAGNLTAILAGGGGSGGPKYGRELAQWPNGAMVQNGNIYLVYRAPYNGIIESLDFFTSVGSFVVTIYINGVPVGDLTNVTVNSATPINVAALTGSNAIATDDQITATISNVVGNPTNAVLNLNINWS